MKFEGSVTLGSVSLLPDSRGGEEEEEVKNKKTEQKQEVFRAFARKPEQKKRTKTRGVPSFLLEHLKKRTKTRGVPSFCSNT